MKEANTIKLNGLLVSIVRKRSFSTGIELMILPTYFRYCHGFVIMVSFPQVLLRFIQVAPIQVSLRRTAT